MWKTVDSSNIAAVQHDPKSSVLSVKFKTGTIYAYQGVSVPIYDRIVKAASVGRIFNELIKAHPDVYPFVKVS